MDDANIKEEGTTQKTELLRAKQDVMNRIIQIGEKVCTIHVALLFLLFFFFCLCARYFAILYFVIFLRKCRFWNSFSYFCSIFDFDRVFLHFDLMLYYIMKYEGHWRYTSPKMYNYNAFNNNGYSIEQASALMIMLIIMRNIINITFRVWV